MGHETVRPCDIRVHVRPVECLGLELPDFESTWDIPNHFSFLSVEVQIDCFWHQVPVLTRFLEIGSPTQPVDPFVPTDLNWTPLRLSTPTSPSSEGHTDLPDPRIRSSCRDRAIEVSAGAKFLQGSSKQARLDPLALAAH